MNDSGFDGVLDEQLRGPRQQLAGRIRRIHRDASFRRRLLELRATRRRVQHVALGPALEIRRRALLRLPRLLELVLVEQVAVLEHISPHIHRRRPRTSKNIGLERGSSSHPSLVGIVLVERWLLRLLLLRDSMPGSGNGLLALPIDALLPEVRADDLGGLLHQGYGQRRYFARVALGLQALDELAERVPQLRREHGHDVREHPLQVRLPARRELRALGLSRGDAVEVGHGFTLVLSLATGERSGRGGGRRAFAC
mmetsp:Transcript_16924/g.48254  ORF Transcript_16924/g.48254 Transcript_16924/m.48254 type:complete len:254 (-) Transcript_16924:67-828(-)